MFQFPRFPLPRLCVHLEYWPITTSGFPHSDIPGSKPAFGSPRLFADCYVLHRLLTPRHSPCALCSLTFFSFAYRMRRFKSPLSTFFWFSTEIVIIEFVLPFSITFSFPIQFSRCHLLKFEVRRVTGEKNTFSLSFFILYQVHWLRRIDLKFQTSPFKLLLNPGN